MAFPPALSEMPGNPVVSPLPARRNSEPMRPVRRKIQSDRSHPVKLDFEDDLDDESLLPDAKGDPLGAGAALIVAVGVMLFFAWLAFKLGGPLS